MLTRVGRLSMDWECNMGDWQLLLRGDQLQPQTREIYSLFWSLGEHATAISFSRQSTHPVLSRGSGRVSWLSVTLEAPKIEVTTRNFSVSWKNLRRTGFLRGWGV